MRLFYFKEKLTTIFLHGSKNIKKLTFQWKNVWKNWENILNIMNAWLRNCRGILASMKKEIKDTKRLGEKCLDNSWAGFNCEFINNTLSIHTYKGRTFFLVTFAKTFGCDSLSLTHTSSNNHGKLPFPFYFFKYFLHPGPFFFSFDLLLIIVGPLHSRTSPPFIDYSRTSTSNESTLRIFHNFSSCTF